MVTPRRSLKDRLAAAGVVAVLAVVIVLLAGVELMLVVLWPWPTLLVTLAAACYTAGLLTAAVWHRIGDELIHRRKDTAIEAAFETAFELQELELRDSGEHPVVERYDPDGEQPLCSWGPDAHLATTRIDIPGLRNAPACDKHVALARLGEVTVADAYPDDLAVIYRERMG